MRKDQVAHMATEHAMNERAARHALRRITKANALYPRDKADLAEIRGILESTLPEPEPERENDGQSRDGEKK